MCSTQYNTIMLQEHPDRAAEMMAYQTAIAKASQRYKWPSWVIYDATFRQEMAGLSRASWARVDPSIYSLCFTGQAISVENWCPNCQTLDHTQQTCPLRSRAIAIGGTVAHQQTKAELCRRYNRFSGDCKFRMDCKFRHACSSCGEAHPASKCRAGDKGEDHTL